MALIETALRLALSDRSPGRIVMHPDTRQALIAELDPWLVRDDRPDIAETIGGKFIQLDEDMELGTFVLAD